MSNARIDSAASALVKAHGGEYAAGFLCTQLKAAVDMLPKSKRQMFMLQLEEVVGSVVTVNVKNCLSGKEVEIRWDQVGGPCDPSTERYHCM